MFADNGDGFSKEVFEEMATKQVAITKGRHFGLGFEICDLENGKIALSHSGLGEGVQTIFFILLETKQELLIFTNSDTGETILEYVIKHYWGEVGQEIVNIETR